MYEKNLTTESYENSGEDVTTDKDEVELATTTSICEQQTTSLLTTKPASTKSNSHDKALNGVDQHGNPFKSVDELYESLGRPGRYAIVVCCLLTLNNFSISPNHAIGVFIGFSPDHTCKPFQSQNHSTDLDTTYSYSGKESVYLANSRGLNLTTDINRTIGLEPNVTHSQCKAVLKAEGHNQKDEERYCTRDQWTYSVSDGESSSVTEWDLVCDRAYLANLANTFYYIGVMVGGILFGYISDNFGRKVALMLSLCTTAGVGVAIVLTHNLMGFFALRTVMGVAIQGVQTSSYIRLVEMFTPRHRSIYVTVYTVFWAVALIGLGLVAWVLKDWRMIQVAVIGQACAASLYLWIVPESLRWLISQGKEERASKLVRRIARFNKLGSDHQRNTKSLIPESSSSAGKKKENASYLDLVRTPQLRRRTILMSYIAFATNVGYWGLTYNTTALVGNKYLNFTLGSVAECTMSVINVFIISRFGKKLALSSYFLCGGVCCVTMSCLLSETSEPFVTVVMIISTLGRLATAGMFVANDLYMAELFPTVVRNMGVGVCTFMGRIGAVLTPQIFTVGLYSFKQFPLIVFGIITIAGGLITFLLPETGKLQLPETLEDVIIVEEPKSSKTKKDVLISTEPINSKNDATCFEENGHTPDNLC